MGIVSEYIREQRRYTKQELADKFKLSHVETDTLIRNLKSAGILYSVNNKSGQTELSELLDSDLVVTDEISDQCLYVFKYVGIIAVGNSVIKCFPKYLSSYSEENIKNNIVPIKEMQQVIKVLNRYAAKEQIVNMYNGDSRDMRFNELAVILYILNDYYEYGLYVNDNEIIEPNGEGAILWDKTINEGFAFIQDNVPYYLDVYTRRTVDSENDFYQRLHKLVLTMCSKQLIDSGLMELFEMEPLDLSDERVSDLGEVEYILYRLQSELNIQFNTRKQSLLKTIYTYLAQEHAKEAAYGLSLFGTNSFHRVWEQVCANVFDNKLETKLKYINVPKDISSVYDKEGTLKSLIEKPHWFGYRENSGQYYQTKDTDDTLIPDLISVYYNEDKAHFAIFDAKYYCIILRENEYPINQPGIGDITKQYLYQLAYKKFVEAAGIDCVTNCFLMPTQGAEVIKYGLAKMDMLNNQGLEPIQIRLLPASKMFDFYLNRETINITGLDL